MPLSGHSPKRDGIRRRRGRDAHYSDRRRIRAGTARWRAVALERGKGQDVKLVNEQLAKAVFRSSLLALRLCCFPRLWFLAPEISTTVDDR